MISYDSETHLIKPGCVAPKLVCGTFDYGGNGREICLREETLDKIEKMAKSDRIVGHHLPFDLGVIAAERPQMLRSIFDAIDDGRVTDTKIRQMMLDNAKGELKFVWDEEKNEFKKQNFSLARLTWRYFRQDLSAGKDGPDIWRLRYNELDDGRSLQDWPQEAIDYAIGDAKWTRRIWERQQKLAGSGGIIGEKSQIQAAWALYLTGMWGVRTNPESVAKLRKEVQADFDEQAAIAQEHGLIRSDGSKNLKKIRAEIEKWYKEHELPMKLTPKGAIGTDREQLMGTDHPGLHAVAEHGKHGKLLKTYVPALERGTMVALNSSFNPIVESFRTSCSGGMKIDGIPLGTNLQNPPRKGGVRECYQAREGTVFIGCDYDTLEMLTLAQTCLDLFGYSKIAEAARRGEDFHLSSAATMMGISYRDAEERLKAGDPYVADVRQVNKISNYGFSGGMQAKTFVEYAKGFGHKIDLSLAQVLYNNFRRQWTEMNDYFNHISTLCNAGESGSRADKVIHPRTGMVRGKVRYTAAANHYFQHLAAIGAKDALYQVTRECYVDAGSPLYGSRPVIFAHDEIIVETPIAAIGPQGAHEAAMRLQQLMVERMKHWCPDVPIAASPAMFKRWYKGAKSLYENGIMVPAKPEGKKWVKDDSWRVS